jgi:hypothetical protein
MKKNESVVLPIEEHEVVLRFVVPEWVMRAHQVQLDSSLALSEFDPTADDRWLNHLQCAAKCFVY